MRMTWSWILVLIFPAFSACDAVLGTDASYLAAVITHQVAESGEDPTEDYEGSGLFNVHASPDRFTLSSEGVGASQGESFNVRRFHGARPAKGTYTIRQSRGILDDQEPGFIAEYWRVTPGGATEGFVAESGEIKITRSSRRYVAGTFDLTGFRWCRYPHGFGDVSDSEGYCDGMLPSIVPDDVPRITVIGSFGATKRPLESVNPTAP